MPENETYSKVHHQFGIDIAMNHVNSLIERRTNLTKNSGTYLSWVKDYLESIKGYLNAVAEGREKNHSFTPYLEEAIKYAGKEKESLSKEEALEIITKFDLLSENVDKLKKNPAVFYNTKAATDMLEFFSNFKL